MTDFPSIDSVSSSSNDLSSSSSSEDGIAHKMTVPLEHNQNI